MAKVAKLSVVQNVERLRPRFTLDREIKGCIKGFQDITERVVNGELGPLEGRAATMALNGVPNSVRTLLQAHSLYQKSSRTGRKEIGKLLGIKE